jgi:hypothetical protein
MRRWEPPTELVIEQPKPRRWPVVVLLLAVIAVAVAGLWMIERRQHAAFRTYVLPVASDVRSALTGVGDSLEVVVTWGLPPAPEAGLPDSVRVEVGLGDGRQSQIKLTSSAQRSDTLHLPLPPAGQSAAGYSCVTTIQAARLSRETCTPWQYVRPSAAVPTSPTADTGKGRRLNEAATVAEIVVQPAGQQVDPDRGGKCASWQRKHPGRSVWVDVNRRAVPDCTGPNGRPTVAKFCAFAVLTDGRGVKTAASANDEYCERLFQAWIRERVA